MTTADSAAAKDWSGVRLHVVTGKGGTGKTTVAGALALALAGRSAGRRRATGPARTPRVLLVEVEGRQGIAQLFDAPPLPYEERRVAVAPGGGEVWALAIDPEQALLEYLDMFYKLGAAAKALRRFGAIDFATTVAPGIRDVLLTGKTCEAVRRRAPDGRGATSTTTRWSWTRRRPAGSPASSTSTPRSPGWPGWARSTTRPTR